VLFIIILFLSIQDVAVDSWALVLLQDPILELPYASMTQTVGMSVGNACGWVLIFTDDKREDRAQSSWVSPPRLSTCVRAWAVLHFLVLICVLVAPEGVNRASTISIRAVVSKIFDITSNSTSLRSLFIVLMLSFVTFACADTIAPVWFFEHGIDQSALLGLVFCQFPVQILVTSYGSWAISKGAHTLDVYRNGILTSLLSAALYPLLAWNIDWFLNCTVLTQFILGTALLTTTCSARKMVNSSMSTYFNQQIAGQTTATATLITLMNCCFNLGNFWPKSLSYLMRERAGYQFTSWLYVFVGLLLVVLVIFRTVEALKNDRNKL